MKRATLNLLIDLLAAILFVGMVASGYILHFALPPGTNKSLSLWSLTRHQWGQVHFWISIGFLAILLLHVALHWQWVSAVVAQRLGLATTGQSRGRAIGSGVIALLAVGGAVGVFAWVTEISVRERKDPPYAAGTGSGEAAYAILRASCFHCHGPRETRGGFRADRREDYFGGGGNAALILPGDSAQSPLIALVEGRRTDMAMAEAHTLREESVTVLRAWIDAGAEWPETREGE